MSQALHKPLFAVRRRAACFPTARFPIASLKLELDSLQPLEDGLRDSIR